jgi:hypothetical protein
LLLPLMTQSKAWAATMSYSNFHVPNSTRNDFVSLKQEEAVISRDKPTYLFR